MFKKIKYVYPICSNYYVFRDVKEGEIIAEIVDFVSGFICEEEVDAARNRASYSMEHPRSIVDGLRRLLPITFHIPSRFLVCRDRLGAHFLFSNSCDGLPGCKFSCHVDDYLGQRPSGEAEKRIKYDYMGMLYRYDSREAHIEIIKKGYRVKDIRLTEQSAKRSHLNVRGKKLPGEERILYDRMCIGQRLTDEELTIICSAFGCVYPGSANFPSDIVSTMILSFPSIPDIEEYEVPESETEKVLSIPTSWRGCGASHDREKHQVKTDATVHAALNDDDERWMQFNAEVYKHLKSVHSSIRFVIINHYEPGVITGRHPSTGEKCWIFALPDDAYCLAAYKEAFVNFANSRVEATVTLNAVDHNNNAYVMIRYRKAKGKDKVIFKIGPNGKDKRKIYLGRDADEGRWVPFRFDASKYGMRKARSRR